MKVSEDEFWTNYDETQPISVDVVPWKPEPIYLDKNTWISEVNYNPKIKKKIKHKHIWIINSVLATMIIANKVK